MQTLLHRQLLCDLQLVAQIMVSEDPVVRMQCTQPNAGQRARKVRKHASDTFLQRIVHEIGTACDARVVSMLCFWL